MTEQADSQLAPEWGWIRDPDFRIGGFVLFAHGVRAERVIQAFGMDPATAVSLPLARSSEALRYPVTDERHYPIHPWIRAGQESEWGFAINQGFMDASELVSAARELSAHTDVAAFQWTMTIDYFRYLVDGTVVTEFEPLGAFERAGTEPDRFLPQIRQVGLRAAPGDTRTTREPRISMLEILTLALGIRLPSDVVHGPLLTVQRGPS
jgi:Family of unknown function (DUF6461)